jgi:hypothetical protein
MGLVYNVETPEIIKASTEGEISILRSLTMWETCGFFVQFFVDRNIKCLLCVFQTRKLSAETHIARVRYFFLVLASNNPTGNGYCQSGTQRPQKENSQATLERLQFTRNPHSNPCRTATLGDPLGSLR